MAYRNYRRASKPAPRTIIVKYAGRCACCGAEIKAGELATYHPAGYLGAAQGRLYHVENLQGDSAQCAFEIGKKLAADRAVNDYAGEGLDARYEDQCRDICGL